MPDAKTALTVDVIPRLARANPSFPYFSLASIRNEIAGRGFELEPDTLTQYLYELMKAGALFDAGRGWYSTLREPFVLNRKPVRELVELLEGKFPFLDFSCWSTEQVAAYGHHILARFCQFVYTERDAIESVGDTLRDAGKPVYVDPLKRDLESHVRLTNGVIIIRPLVTRAPVDGHFALMEKILVDLFKECDDLNLLDRAEVREIEKNVVNSARISISTVFGYAERRNAGKEMLAWAVGQ